MTTTIDLRVRFPVDDAALSELHGLAFGSDGAQVEPWAARGRVPA